MSKPDLMRRLRSAADDGPLGDFRPLLLEAADMIEQMQQRIEVSADMIKQVQQRIADMIEQMQQRIEGR